MGISDRIRIYVNRDLTVIACPALHSGVWSDYWIWKVCSRSGGGRQASVSAMHGTND